MEFPTNISKYLKVNEQGFIICTGRNFNKFIQSNYLNQGTQMIHQIINELGANSAKSQGLKQIITSTIKFQGTDHRLYLKVQANKAIGFMRTGQKKLFYHDNLGSMKQITPTCVLDIYVHQSYQRTGIGKEIFQTFLLSEDKRPQKLAYDRPSPKLIAFLKKYYGLSKFIPQNNNFVIFDQYFSSTTNGSLKQMQLKSEQQFKGTSLNRTFKYENKQNNQQMPLVEMTKQLNKTLKTLNSSSNRQSKLLIRNQQKMQDSLSLLEKQMNRMNIKNSNTLLVSQKELGTISGTNYVIKQGKQKQIQTKQRLQTLQNSKSSLQNKSQNKNLTEYQKQALIYKNYTPWATGNDLIFRTTSNSYGSYYAKKN